MIDWIGPGEGSGPEALLVPGAACDARVWVPSLPFLRRGLRCFPVSPPGFAGTPRAPGPTLDALHEALLGWVTARPAPPALVGHSLGAFVALRLAIAAPAAVGPLVLVDGVPAFGDLFAPGAPADVLAREAARRVAGLAGSTPDQMLRRHREAFAPLFRDPGAADAQARAAAASDPDALAEALRALYCADLRPDLARVRSPVLLVLPDWPGFPRALIRARVGDYLRQLEDLEDVRHEIVAGTQHFVMVDEPAAFARTVINFLVPRG